MAMQSDHVTREPTLTDAPDALTAVVAKKTNSDRGKEFRAKRKKYEAALAGVVDDLRHEVDDLHFLRGVRQEKVLRSRNSVTGSLARLVQEYFVFFQCGMPNAVNCGRKRVVMGYDDPDELETQQLAFLKAAMHPDLRFGEVHGVDALVDQWKRYTSYHASLRVEVMNIEVSGPQECPIVIVTSHLHVRISRDTFTNVFPHVADNEELVQRFIGKDVTYRGVNQYQFTDDGQIIVYDSDVGFVDAFYQAGASFEDIALLMNHALIAHYAILGEDESSCSSSTCGSPEADCDGWKTNESHERAMRPRRVFEILSEKEDDDEDDDEDGESPATDDNQALEICDADKAESCSVEEPEATEVEQEKAAESPETTSRLDIRFLLS